jgi:hypothetical protein
MKIDRLVRSGRRMVGLEIGPDAALTVRAPLRLPLAGIGRIVDGKRQWILRKQEEARRRAARQARRRDEQGGRFLYLGRSWPLGSAARPLLPLALCGDSFLIDEARRGEAAGLFAAWYRREAGRLLPPRVHELAGAMGVRPARVRIGGARSRWGSCSASGALHFSWRLVMAPPEVIDYVIVHELAHLRRHDHSRRFWAVVEEFLPGFREPRRWLKENGFLLSSIESKKLVDEEKGKRVEG